MLINRLRLNLLHLLGLSNISGVHTFEIFLICESQADLVPVTTGALAVLGDSSTEARHTAAINAEVTIRTVAYRG